MTTLRPLVSLLLSFATWPTLAGSGDLDTTFGTGGVVVTSVGGPTLFDPHPRALNNGKLLLSGAQFNGHDYDFAVMRMQANGSLDTSFGTSGIAQFEVFGGNEIAKSIVVQNDGKILLGGEAPRRSGGYSSHAVIRLTADGAIDTSFGTSGRVVTDFGLTSHIHALALQSDGKILGIGETYSSVDGGTVAVVRYNADGSLDTSFGSSGKSLPVSGNANAHAIAQLSDGRILIAGYYTPSGTTPQFFVARLGASGALDASFGSGGIAQLAIGSGANHGNAMQVQSDGKILVAGGAQMSAGSNYDFAVVRLTGDGLPDTSFGTNGIVTTGFTSGGTPSNEEGAAMLLQPDGKILVAGYSNKKFAIVRYTSNGALDTAFAGGGKSTLAIGGTDDWAKGLSLMPDGRIVVAGYSVSSGDYMVAAARLQNDSGGAQADYDRLFNWGEGMYPAYFPAGPITQSVAGYMARLYSTGYALGTKDGRLYVYGALFGGLRDLGPLPAWTSQAFAAGY